MSNSLTICRSREKLKFAKKDFKTEMKFYYDLKKSRASAAELRAALNDIIQKYTKLGIDTKECQKQLEKLNLE